MFSLLEAGVVKYAVTSIIMKILHTLVLARLQTEHAGSVVKSYFFCKKGRIVKPDPATLGAVLRQL